MEIEFRLDAEHGITITHELLNNKLDEFIANQNIQMTHAERRQALEQFSTDPLVPSYPTGTNFTGYYETGEEYACPYPAILVLNQVGPFVWAFLQYQSRQLPTHVSNTALLREITLLGQLNNRYCTLRGFPDNRSFRFEMIQGNSQPPLFRLVKVNDPFFRLVFKQLSTLPQRPPYMIASTTAISDVRFFTALRYPLRSTLLAGMKSYIEEAIMPHIYYQKSELTSSINRLASLNGLANLLNAASQGVFPSGVYFTFRQNGPLPSGPLAPLLRKIFAWHGFDTPSNTELAPRNPGNLQPGFLIKSVTPSGDQFFGTIEYRPHWNRADTVPRWSVPRVDQTPHPIAVKPCVLMNTPFSVRCSVSHRTHRYHDTWLHAAAADTNPCQCHYHERLVGSNAARGNFLPVDCTCPCTTRGYHQQLPLLLDHFRSFLVQSTFNHGGDIRSVYDILQDYRITGAPGVFTAAMEQLGIPPHLVQYRYTFEIDTTPIDDCGYLWEQTVYITRTPLSEDCTEEETTFTLYGLALNNGQQIGIENPLSDGFTEEFSIISSRELQAGDFRGFVHIVRGYANFLGWESASGFIHIQGPLLGDPLAHAFEDDSWSMTPPPIGSAGYGYLLCYWYTDRRLQPGVQVIYNQVSAPNIVTSTISSPFETNQYTLTQDARLKLAWWLAEHLFVLSFPNSLLTVKGFSSALDDEAHNFVLSVRRAQSVSSEIVTLTSNVFQARLRIEAFGERQADQNPVTTPEGRTQSSDSPADRRVEVHLSGCPPLIFNTSDIIRLNP